MDLSSFSEKELEPQSGRGPRLHLAGPEGSPGLAGTGLQPPDCPLPGRQWALRGSCSPLCPIKHRCRLSTDFSAVEAGRPAPCTQAAVCSPRQPVWGPSPSGPVCLDLENQDVSTAQGCLLILLEPTEGPWVTLPRTRGCVGADLGQPGSQDHTQAADKATCRPAQVTTPWGEV